ncbi:hypothetical protein BC936DRAFT_136726 [Jimgerdemannia flammicorona]|uniref:Zn(2)-C6 fungal-type domain-containing protein n=1 Tax=Jimgerdemannia flammicorona TaxID=994334 RepID=A0A433CZ03_9FUNG|nr:hypothetical protein BC936DRAFT_136726 [Jimgerdemannia flammicorona]
MEQYYDQNLFIVSSTTLRRTSVGDALFPDITHQRHNENDGSTVRRGPEEIPQSPIRVQFRLWTPREGQLPQQFDGTLAVLSPPPITGSRVADWIVETGKLQSRRNPTKGGRVALACDTCNTSHRKCSGKPDCKQCRVRKIPCTYKKLRKLEGRKRKEKGTSDCAPVLEDKI